ncbi:Probable ATP-dependent DNA helicase RecQ [Geodia barretti]|uniref:DNA 3'-5' helicase n=1 Tax=Geodia barretti TaxID=519541 RepID=A0AA35TEY4_GEOBA|nr:Probable ATP-dependent DNA helicase RecQ [Geodia barretti]
MTRAAGIADLRRQFHASEPEATLLYEWNTGEPIVPRQGGDGFCHWLRDRRCSVYTGRPLICSFYLCNFGDRLSALFDAIVRQGVWHSYVAVGWIDSGLVAHNPFVSVNDPTRALLGGRSTSTSRHSWSEWPIRGRRLEARTDKGCSHMTYVATRALALLRTGVADSDAEFRTGQEEAIRHVVEANGRLLVVQKTGWGKSFVYFIATKLLREQGMGPALLVSPLLALMRNQIDAAQRMGVRAETINSDNQQGWREVEASMRRNEVDILLVSPERFANERFRDEVLAEIADRIALIVIDEAHCISDWGHDFRPHYRLIERMLHILPPNLRLLATTATANDRVLQDLAEILGPNLEISRGDLSRSSLALQTIRMSSQAERLAWLADQIPKFPGSGIVYTLTVRDAEQVAGWLKTRGIDVEAYTGRTGDGRAELEQALLDNKLKALVATTALGMGFDKPDLTFVVHYQTPGSVVAYYQQVGRAGRALDAAYGVLLSGAEEIEITDYFIESAFPTRDQVAAVLRALEAAPEGLSIRELESKVNVSNGRILKTIQLLSLESPEHRSQRLMVSGSSRL